MSKKPATNFVLLLVLLALVAAGLTPLAAFARTWTDQPSYAPGAAVTISGDNSDGAGFQTGETVHVSVSGPSGFAASCDATPDAAGAWSCQITLAANDSAIGKYTYTATGQTSGVVQSGKFSDSGCKDANALGTVLNSTDLGATFAVSGNTATYSITYPNKSPSDGVPGLIEYCVYPGSTAPDTATPTYDSWMGAISSPFANHGFFDFERPDGNPTNLPFGSGSPTTVGTATWSGGVPGTQTIVLHINDPTECNDLYGGNPGTCSSCPQRPGT